jgi:hypothetical protein
MTHFKRAALALVVGLTTMGSDCINDPFLVSVNLENVALTINIAAGTTTTYAGTRTITAAEYVDVGFGPLSNLRIYDITVQTVGTYAGTVTGSASVNGTAIVSYTGNWSQYATPQSLLGDPGLTLNAAGVTALRNAVQSELAVTVAGSGSVSVSPVPAGLSVIVRIYAQVDAEP